MRTLALLSIVAFALHAEAKTFQNSYVAFEVPDDWTCVQEGVAWTCTPQNPVFAKEAVIVLAAKVAGPEDNVNNFLSYLKQPKKVITKVGTPVPSKVMYAQQRALAGNVWVQAQHIGSEIQEYYTLYLATVKEQLAILVSFSAERNRYQKYNPVFDRAIKTLRIVATQKLLFHKTNTAGAGDMIGIQGGPGAQVDPANLLPPPEKKSKGGGGLMLWIGLAAILLAGVYYMTSRKGASSSKKRTSRPK
ncbi:MAG: hypothetical protein KF799_16315 [Bdellovibrionales bacterium]|nr:hypothetical protein [Bdellovibrionales bacterium]